MISAPLKLFTLDEIPPTIELGVMGSLAALVGTPYRKRRMEIGEMSTQQHQKKPLWVGPVLQVSSAYQRTSESHNIWGVEISNKFLAIWFRTPRHHFKPVVGKQVMHVRDCVKTPCKNSQLNCHQPGHHHLVTQQHYVPVDLILTINTQLICLIRNWCSDIILGFRIRLQVMGLIRQGMAGRHL